eukprot:TRINITY_DN1608_c0_g1_i1.p1 TRINITY_DN1608_c0_g1~~TRINITY_DN1608_c0_g1_i1.p1  ORF type:complete len:425 (-),score=24.12 TRINITY_DN1608_c0_g1_i1:950-2224(-)
MEQGRLSGTFHSSPTLIGQIQANLPFYREFLGLQQHYLLGQSRRQKYVKLLPDSYDPSLVYARATHYNRTIDSLNHYLLGLYPDTNTDNVYITSSNTGPEIERSPFFVIQTFPNPNEKVLTVESCPYAISKIMGFYSTDHYDKLITKYEPLWQALIKAYPDISLEYIIKGYNAFLLADYLICSEFEGLKLDGITAKAIEDCKGFIGDVLKGMLSYDELLGKIWLHELSKEIVRLMDNAMQNKSAVKYAVYAGHDTTLTMLLLGIKEFNSSVEWGQVPSFASSVLFELEDKVVIVYYNDKLIYTEEYNKFKQDFLRLGNLMMPLEKACAINVTSQIIFNANFLYIIFIHFFEILYHFLLLLFLSAWILPRPCLSLETLQVLYRSSTTLLQTLLLLSHTEAENKDGQRSIQKSILTQTSLLSSIQN